MRSSQRGSTRRLMHQAFHPGYYWLPREPLFVLTPKRWSLRRVDKRGPKVLFLFSCWNTVSDQWVGNFLEAILAEEINRMLPVMHGSFDSVAGEKSTVSHPCKTDLLTNTHTNVICDCMTAVFWKPGSNIWRPLPIRLEKLYWSPARIVWNWMACTALWAMGMWYRRWVRWLITVSASDESNY